MTEQTYSDQSISTPNQHHHAVQLVANALVRKGYQVQAHHIDWPDGSPRVAIEGYKPDLMAFRESKVIFVQVETCSTYRSSKVGHPLSLFSQKGTAWIIIPFHCGNRDNPLLYMREALRDWGLSGVKIGTYNPESGQVDLPKE
ncbi:hypothetical protein [Desmospora activa]|uniref:Uncharacterized protein n=1 Tax=Desmospora activa DSM 45169 TaxID=1121389 RepID=A0A2T4ZB66_9BACL|nr:hypothetical protein [Desmospora activa]PTM59144.1 hypothetical protein C8J48_1746 [Desmospora activa DSM 45169]